jgi:hypothetical protein
MVWKRCGHGRNSKVHLCACCHQRASKFHQIASWIFVWSSSLWFESVTHAMITHTYTHMHTHSHTSTRFLCTYTLHAATCVHTYMLPHVYTLTCFMCAHLHAATCVHTHMFYVYTLTCCHMRTHLHAATKKLVNCIWVTKFIWITPRNFFNQQLGFFFSWTKWFVLLLGAVWAQTDLFDMYVLLPKHDRKPYVAHGAEATLDKEELFVLNDQVCSHYCRQVTRVLHFWIKVHASLSLLYSYPPCLKKRAVKEHYKLQTTWTELGSSGHEQMLQRFPAFVRGSSIGKQCCFGPLLKHKKSPAQR